MRKLIIGTLSFCALTAIIASCQNQSQIDFQNYMSSGKDIYSVKCQNCHGVNGEGLGELAPPLTDTTALKNNKTRLACIIKNGMNEKVVVHGKTYEGKMPSFNEMADIELAQVIVYITNTFGNKQGFYPYQKIANDLQQCN